MPLKELFDEGLYVASRLMEANNRHDALTVLQLLAENEAFGDVRMMACINCALVSGYLGNVDDALAWYDRAIAIEAAHATRFAARRKAGYLAEIGRNDESLALYMELLSGPLPPEEAEQIRAAIDALDGPAA